MEIGAGFVHKVALAGAVISGLSLCWLIIAAFMYSIYFLVLVPYIAVFFVLFMFISRIAGGM